MSKRNMPSAINIAKHWYDELLERCGKLTNEDGYLLCFSCQEANIALERAHILAKIEGGDDSLDNLHLLCPYCHRDTESISGELYWIYMKRAAKSRHHDSLIQRVQDIKQMVEGGRIKELPAWLIEVITKNNLTT